MVERRGFSTSKSEKIFTPDLMGSLIISLNLMLLTGEGAKESVNFDARTWLGRLGSSLSTYGKIVSKGRDSVASLNTAKASPLEEMNM